MCWWDQYSQAASAGFGTRVHWRWPGGGQWETLHKPQTIPKSTGTFFWLMKTRRYVPPRTVSNGPLGATMTLWNYWIYWYMTTCQVPVGLLSTHTSYVTQQQTFKYLFLTAQSQTEDARWPQQKPVKGTYCLLLHIQDLYLIEPKGKRSNSCTRCTHKGLLALNLSNVFSKH